MRIVFVLLLFTYTQAKPGFGPGDQDYGYVTVRQGAHMFWWLHHTMANVTNSHDRPLIMWLAGGPGGSSCGSGNFGAVGPQDIDLRNREHNWVKDYNVLFVDSPVGSGYSFVEDVRFLNKNNKEIATDLIELLRKFFDALPQFKTSPFYIHGDGYGSKYAAEVAPLLYEAIQENTIESNFVGISMGSSMISPIDATLMYSPYLYQLSYVDEAGSSIIRQHALFVKQRLDEGKHYHATLEWSMLLEWIFVLTDGIDYNNIIKKYVRPGKGPLSYDKMYMSSKNINSLMNDQVKQALGIPNYVTWGGQAILVNQNLVTDFMLPLTETIKNLLRDTNIEVHIVNGNLNLLTNTPGQLAWIDDLDWPKSNEFQNATRTTIWVDDIMEGYQKSGGGMNFYWMNVAGLDFYNENPKGTREFLKTMTGL